MATSFQELIDRTVSSLPASECENLSPQVCFICGLHLCNEKGLEIRQGADPKGDFTLLAPRASAAPG